LEGIKIKQTMKAVFYIFVACFVLAISYLSAAPMAPVDPVDIKGTIVYAEWTPERKVKGMPGASGSLGSDRTFPAQYRIQLKDFKVFYPKETSWKWIGESMEMGYPTIEVILPEKNKRALGLGMDIMIRGYTRRGDEGGTWYYNHGVEIVIVENWPTPQNTQTPHPTPILDSTPTPDSSPTPSLSPSITPVQEISPTPAGQTDNNPTEVITYFKISFVIILLALGLLIIAATLVVVVIIQKRGSRLH
jgi:hypothetical protein